MIIALYKVSFLYLLLRTIVLVVVDEGQTCPRSSGQNTGSGDNFTSIIFFVGTYSRISSTDRSGQISTRLALENELVLDFDRERVVIAEKIFIFGLIEFDHQGINGSVSCYVVGLWYKFLSERGVIP